VMLILALILFKLSNCYDNGVARTPPMGWTTWCTDNAIIPCLDDFCDEVEIRSVADFMKSGGLISLGYTYILLDDCWGGGRTPGTNEIYPDKWRFPSAMKALADYLHNLGLKLGLYTDVGEHTCRDGRPGSWPFYQQDANTFASWGVDMVKMDWCGHPGAFDAQQLYTNMSHALNKTGRPMLFNMCGWGLSTPWIWGPNVANTWRVGPDHLPLWWTPPTNQDPGQGQGTANIIQHMAGLSKYAGPGGWNDPDFLMPGEWWLEEIDSQTEFSFWCLFSAPLFVATDIRVLSDKQVILNKEAIAINQDPLGFQGDIRLNNSNGGQVWSKQIQGNRWAVILYNSNIEIGYVQVTVNWTQHLPNWPRGKTTAKLRDIWLHQDIGSFKTSYTSAYLQPHQIQFLVVS